MNDCMNEPDILDPAATVAHEPFTREQIAKRMRLFIIIDQLCADWFPLMRRMR